MKSQNKQNQPLKTGKDDLGDYKGDRKLKNRGGAGQEGVGIIDGTVLTLKENAALAIAKDVMDDAGRHHGCNPAALSLIQIAPFAAGRTEGKPCTDGQVLAEIGRLQNHAEYGDKVIRRAAH